MLGEGSEVREFIISEIRRLSSSTSGNSLGRRAFEKETGIRESEWRGVYWARWSDALLEAGFSANGMQGRTDRGLLLEKLASACAHFQRMPTVAEYELLRKQDLSYPSYKTFQSNFGVKENIIWELRNWLVESGKMPDLIEPLGVGRPRAIPNNARTSAKTIVGYVYLLHSGRHYKIGRSDDIERRFRQVKVALPEAVKLIHAIRTDDPPGIEAYWHRRFAEKRANGEWFSLSGEDVKIFKKRTFQ